MIRVQEIGALIPPALTANLRPDAVDAVLANVAAAARNHWIGLAEDDPSSFRTDYAAGIQEVAMRPGTAVIALVGEIPHLLEDGRTNEDMRDFLLGPEVPVTPVGTRGKHRNARGGYYRAIPIRHTTPGTGKAAGQAMGDPYGGDMAEADSKKLGQEVYEAAQKLAPLVTGPGGAKSWGGEEGQQRRLGAGVGGATLLKPHHKTDIYAGMIRTEKTYEKATQAQYVTFRTISTSVQEGWFRTIAARHYAQKVADFASRMAARAFKAYLEVS